ncbi:MAG: M24 family metallopeptidase [Sediminispirochaetaceae bacterium]
MNCIERVSQIKMKMAEMGVECSVIFKPENRTYLSGFTGTSGYVVLTADETLFATDFRYQEQAAAECTGYNVKIISPDYTIFSLIRDLNVASIGLEETFASMSFHELLRDNLPGVTVRPIEGLIRELRMRKDKHEIELIRTACGITDEAFAQILEYIKPGVTEREISTELQYYMKKRGADATPDTFIVATGARASLPHGKATDKPVETGDFVTLDIGCRYKGYWSDMTRTVVVGKAAEKQREIYEIVFGAQQKINGILRPGITGAEADSIAREYISRAGYGREFGHGLGHGLGMEMHELPRLAQTEEGSFVLAPGMVVTNEPGIYIQGFGGVRIEDDVLITEDGCEILCRSPKQLIELD